MCPCHCCDRTEINTKTVEIKRVFTPLEFIVTTKRTSFGFSVYSESGGGFEKRLKSG